MTKRHRVKKKGGGKSRGLLILAGLAGLAGSSRWCADAFQAASSPCVGSPAAGGQRRGRPSAANRVSKVSIRSSSSISDSISKWFSHRHQSGTSFRTWGWHPGAEPVEEFEDEEDEGSGKNGETAFLQRWRDRQIQDMLESSDIRWSSVNDLLEPNYLEMKRYIIRPDEAFGCIFMLDVVTDVGEGLLQPTWARVAEEYGLEVPSAVNCQRALGGSVAEQGVTRYMGWTSDYSEARKYILSFASSVKSVVEDYSPQALPGAANWLELLKEANVPMAVISDLPEEVVDRVLEESGLAPYFDAKVTAEDEAKGDILQAYLRASLKIKRAPNRCTIFDCRPHGCLRAHEGQYKVVALVGVHPMYDLTVADHTVLSFNELRVQNIRRLFADRSYEPELELEPKAEPKRKLKVLTATKTLEADNWGPPGLDTETESDDGGDGARSSPGTRRRRW